MDNSETRDLLAMAGAFLKQAAIEGRRRTSEEWLADFAAHVLRSREAAEVPRFISYGPGRCEVCGWQLSNTDYTGGCVPGNCSFRPDNQDDQRRLRARRDEIARHAKSAEVPMWLTSCARCGRSRLMPDGNPMAECEACKTAEVRARSG
jgi:hypothetical protein